MRNKKAARNVLVCIENGCDICGKGVILVPDDCDYGILHLLESKTGGIQERKRQSGKSTELMVIARKIAEAGHRVYYVTPTLSMSPGKGSMRAFVDGVKFFSLGQANGGTTRGMEPGYLIMDEIQPEDFENVRREFYPSVLVAAYYTALP